MRPRRAAPAGRDSNAIVLAACRPNQYAYDAEFGGTYHGAMTYFALRAIGERGHDLSYAALHARMLTLMRDAGFAQHSELQASASHRRRRLFS